MKFLGGLRTKKEGRRFNFTSIILATPSHSRQHLRRVITSATVVMFPNVVSRASSALPSKELPRVGTIHPPCDSFSKSRLENGERAKIFRSFKSLRRRRGDSGSN